MKYTVRFTVFVLLLSPLNAFSQYQCTGSNNTARCPPCYYNQTAPAHHGIVNGRRQMNVFIQGGTGPDSWDNPPGSGNTNTQIWSGVQGARNMWNTAVDTTSNPGTTNRQAIYATFDLTLISLFDFVERSALLLYNANVTETKVDIVERRA